jgi:putative flippase GtrA
MPVTLSTDAPIQKRSLSTWTGELARFGFVGVLSNLVYFGGLWVLRTAALPWWVAASIAYALSMVLNYLLQRSFTFKSTRAHGEAGKRYVVAQLGGMAINSATLEILLGQRALDWALGPALSGYVFALSGLPELPLRVLVGQGLALVANTAYSYVTQRFWVFRAEARG